MRREHLSWEVEALEEALLDAVAAELHGAWDGPPVYVIVPDAAAMRCEREILRRLPHAGSLRLRVASPARAAAHLLRAMGGGVPDTLSAGSLRAQIRLRSAAGNTLAALGLPPQTVSGAERRLAHSVEELLWHQEGFPQAARAAIGAARADALASLAAPFLAEDAPAVPESVLYWRCAAMLRRSAAPPGSVHWAGATGTPALSALHSALSGCGMPFTDWPADPPALASQAVRAGVRTRSFVCRDLEDEARAAVLHCRELLSQGASPGEIAIACADGSSRPILRRLLQEARIPADFGAAPSEGQPLVECVAGLLALAAGGPDPERLVQVVGSGLVPPPGAARDALLLALRAPRGGSGLDLLPPPLLAGAREWPASAPFAQHLRHLAGWLSRLGLPQASEALGDDARGTQDAIWNAFWTLAQGAAQAAGDVPVPKAAALRAALDLLGSAHPAHGPRRGGIGILDLAALSGASYPHVLLLGVSEGAFPRRTERQGLLGPDALHAAATAGAPLGREPKALRRAAEDEALMALAAARNTLWLSAAARGEKGSQGFSPLAAEVAQPAPWTAPRSPDGGVGSALSAREAGIGIASAIARRRDIRAEDAELLPIAAAHLAVFGDGPHFAGFAPRLPEPPVGRVEGEIAVTALEQFGACRFRWLGGRLRLGGEEAADALDPRTRGTLMHGVLAALPYEELSENALEGAVRAHVAAAAEEEPELFSLRDASGPRASALREETVQEILRAVRMVAAERRATDFRIVGRELAFGRGKPLGPLEVPLPDGGTAELRGRIDRLEEAEGFLRVTDFKVRTHQHFDFTRFFHGVDLQAGAYLLAALRSAAGAGRRGAVAAYWPVRVALRTPPDDDEPSDERLWQGLRSRGLFLGAATLLPLLDRRHPGGGSPFHPLALKNDGSFTKASAAIPEDLWPHVERHIAATLGRLGAELREGAAEPNPYAYSRENACGTCDLLPVCRYEANVEGYRRLEEATVEAVRDA